MAVTRIWGNEQIADLSIDIGKLYQDFLGGTDWNITNGAENATITGLQDPSNNQDAATKHYVDLAIQGIHWKESVQLGTETSTGTITLSGVQTVDGYSTSTGMRILVKNQSTGSQNGIYIANDGGAWTRASDYAAGMHAAGTAIIIERGINNADTAWLCVTDSPTDIIGTDSLSYTKFSSIAAYTASYGVEIVSNDIRLNLQTNSGLDITANEVAVKADAVGGANLAKVINVSGNGVAVKIDNHSIIENGSNQLEVDVTNIIDTAYGLTENTNNIRVNLAANGGLGFTSTGAIQITGPSSKEIIGEKPAVTNNNPSVTLANSPVTGSVRVYLNGLRQVEGGGDDYTISGSVITFNFNLHTAHDRVLVDYYKA